MAVSRRSPVGLLKLARVMTVEGVARALGQLAPAVYLAANAWEEDLVFALPTPPPGRQWARVVDTAEPSPGDIAALGEEELLEDQRHVVARAYSCVVLRSV